MEKENKTAQEIIDETEIRESNVNDFIEKWYPTYFRQKQADRNITKILKELK